MFDVNSVPESPTDQVLDWLRTSPKTRVSSSREHAKGKFTERQYECVSDGNPAIRFRVFVSWNTRYPRVSFSAGLQALLPKRSITLCRYNAGGHLHTNRIEKNCLRNVAHIHRATQRYMESGADAEGYAEETDRYLDVETALRCLVKDCNIRGILKDDPDGSVRSTPDLFDPS
ncbi:hypothetical protein [Piscinibacter gummiphilus]|uniref:Uncharacterized protein n=1 Tax=Piscinibacter gummiphilus TaxID=946333 RepID=A0ABZ0D7S1_9BURK|nr:hypothetical protein [Piscinibacter gummiphilus]WOB10754.1 hypothetical protein RXV79_12020 [Piscinibacter gummiphilus]